jgi:hypothetical protein
MKRAITLGGGGPAAGLHIGVLEGLKNNKIEFDVWALSCIGAWVGIVYNQFDDDQVERTYNFFRDGVFRDDASYSGFPVNMAFGPDVGAHSRAVIKFLSNPLNYANPLPPTSLQMLSEKACLFGPIRKTGARRGISTAGC